MLLAEELLLLLLDDEKGTVSATASIGALRTARDASACSSPLARSRSAATSRT